MNRSARHSGRGIAILALAAILVIALAWILLDRRHDTLSIDAGGTHAEIRSDAVGEAREAAAELREGAADAGRKAADTAAGLAEGARDAGSRAAEAVEDAWEAPAVIPVPAAPAAPALAAPAPAEPKAVLRIGDSDITVSGPVVGAAQNAGAMARDAAGAAASGIGNVLQRAGSALERSGQDLAQ